MLNCFETVEQDEIMMIDLCDNSIQETVEILFHFVNFCALASCLMDIVQGPWTQADVDTLCFTTGKRNLL